MTRAEAAIALAEHLVATRQRNPSGGHSRLLLDYIDAAARESVGVVGDTRLQRVLTAVRELLAADLGKSKVYHHGPNRRGRIEAYERVIQVILSEQK